MADVVGIHHLDLIILAFLGVSVPITDQGDRITGFQAQAGKTLVIFRAIAEIRLGQAVDIDRTGLIHQVEVAISSVDIAGNRTSQLILLGFRRLSRIELGDRHCLDACRRLRGIAALFAAFIRGLAGAIDLDGDLEDLTAVVGLGEGRRRDRDNGLTVGDRGDLDDIADNLGLGNALIIGDSRHLITLVDGMIFHLAEGQSVHEELHLIVGTDDQRILLGIILPAIDRNLRVLAVHRLFGLTAVHRIDLDIEGKVLGEVVDVAHPVGTAVHLDRHGSQAGFRGHAALLEGSHFHLPFRRHEYEVHADILVRLCVFPEGGRRNAPVAEHHRGDIAGRLSLEEVEGRRRLHGHRGTESRLPGGHFVIRHQHVDLREGALQRNAVVRGGGIDIHGREERIQIGVVGLEAGLVAERRNFVGREVHIVCARLLGEEDHFVGNALGERQGDGLGRGAVETLHSPVTIAADLGGGDQGTVGSAECRDIQLERTRSVIQGRVVCLGHRAAQVHLERDRHRSATHRGIRHRGQFLHTGRQDRQGGHRHQGIKKPLHH